MDGLTVEFLPEVDPPEDEVWPGLRSPHLTLGAATLAALGLITAAVTVIHVEFRSEIAGQAVAVAKQCAPVVCAVDPSPAVRAAFAAHLPGAAVMSERTAAGSKAARTLESRTIKAVYGNVEMTMTIAPAFSAEPARSQVRLSHDGYVIDYNFVGYYPPNAGELRALAEDPRLTSL